MVVGLMTLLVVVQTLSRVRLFCDPIDRRLQGSSVHGISQARILDWVAISLSRESSQFRDQAYISCIGRWVLLPLSHQGSPIDYLPHILPIVFSIYHMPLDFVCNAFIKHFFIPLYTVNCVYILSLYILCLLPLQYDFLHSKFTLIISYLFF